jgi:hypothetical protein
VQRLQQERKYLLVALVQRVQQERKAQLVELVPRVQQERKDLLVALVLLERKAVQVRKAQPQLPVKQIMSYHFGPI